jgi:hypothetical protein
MLPISLLRENLFQIDGVGPSIDVSRATGKLLVLTLGITRILEQESVEVSIWGSTDGINWGSKPLTSFPPKSYCGLYSILLNLSARRETRQLRAQWKMNRWSKSSGNTVVMCTFYLEAEESGARIQSRMTAEAELIEEAAVA